MSSDAAPRARLERLRLPEGDLVADGVAAHVALEQGIQPHLDDLEHEVERIVDLPEDRSIREEDRGAAPRPRRNVCVPGSTREVSIHRDGVRSDAAAAPWIFRRDESRRRCGLRAGSSAAVGRCEDGNVTAAYGLGSRLLRRGLRRGYFSRRHGVCPRRKISARPRVYTIPSVTQPRSTPTMPSENTSRGASQQPSKNWSRVP